MKEKKKAKPTAAKTPTSNTVYLWLAFIIISILTLLVFAKGLSNEFVVDDDLYITGNKELQNLNVGYFFTTIYAGNYQPLLFTLYAFIYNISGLEPHAYHVASLLFHMANCGLVLWFIYLLTGSRFISIAVSLLFAIHPTHVESVAWASELKDVGYAFFFLLTLIQYVLYLKTGKRQFYFLAILFFILSFLFKGQAIALVAVLPLLDYFLKGKINWLDKIPFAVLAVAGAFIIIKAAGETIKYGVSYSLYDRLLFAAYAYITYLAKLFMPLHLSGMYPYPEKTAMLYVYVFLCAVLAGICFWQRTNKKFIFGIGFFTATVFMMLMILAVGAFLMGDRYTYVASIGVFYLMAEGVYFLYTRNRYYAAPFVLLIAFYLYGSSKRIEVWQNKETYYSDVLEKYPDVSLARYERANYYLAHGKPALALADINVNIDNLSKGQYSSQSWETLIEKRATCYFTMDSFQQALKNYTLAIDSTKPSSQLYPMLGTVYWNRASTYYKLSQQEGMIADLKMAAKYGHPAAKEIVRNNKW